MRMTELDKPVPVAVVAAMRRGLQKSMEAHPPRVAR
jgi:hypothetical protein